MRKLAYFIGSFALPHSKLPGSPPGGWEEETRGEERSFSFDSFSLRYRTQKKVIVDRVAQEKGRGFLALLGTPLCFQPDSELLNAFLKDPLEFVSSEEGHFALIGYDPSAERVVLATDVNSLVPIFFAEVRGGFVFSSSELFLAQYLGSELDPIGFAQSISLGAPWGNRSRFAGINKLGPAEIVYLKRGEKPKRLRYLVPQKETLWGKSFERNLENFLNTLTHSVDLFWQKSLEKNEVWADLTAGEDARLVVSASLYKRLPLKIRTGGFPGSKDIEIATEAARNAGIEITLEPYVIPDGEVLSEDPQRIILACDGYRSFFYACVRYATSQVYPPKCFHTLHFAGMPGGEAFRGTYYRRAKILFPRSLRPWNPSFFLRLKYLLDFVPNLFSVSDGEILESVTAEVNSTLKEVESLPVGLRVDHLLRNFQTALWGLSRRTPFYLPLATASMTRAIYQIDPGIKLGGKLTRAATEILCPSIAWVKTEKGVPTVRRNLSRLHLFLPEKIASARKILKGFTRRFLHLGQKSSSLSGYHRADLYDSLMRFLFNTPPYSSWFSSPEEMLTGDLYNKQTLENLLKQAREGRCRYVEVLGRIINAELALRWVRRSSFVAAGK